MTDAIDPSVGRANSGTKRDPESLVLRGSPRPVVRFRRGLIVGIAGVFCCALIALSWFALEPPSFRKVADQATDGEALGRPALDALAKAPASYGDVPRLGPPLPGDLGRPILETERERSGSDFPRQDATMGEGANSQLVAREREQHALAASEAARSSPVLVQLARSSSDGLGESATGKSAQGPIPVADSANSADAHADDEHGSDSQGKLKGSPSPWTISAGSIIPATLVTGLNSDQPGMVVAQVTEAVRDSATGRTVLIPQGARLIGNYENKIGFGQRRALLIWDRIIFPDSSSIDLDKMPAVDEAGSAGLSDKVDFHTARLLQGIAMASLLGVGSQFSLSRETGTIAALRDALQQATARAGDQLTQRNLDVQPTITVRPGFPVRAIVNKDLVLRPWKG